jgi:gamma-glutamyltranspeptidase/glutathione hydrolase
MVSAGDSLAAAAALRLLQNGANAIEAAVAASAVQAVVEWPWCGLGGDAFMLVATPDGGVVAFNGSGAAPRDAHAGLVSSPRWPRVGPLSVAVPGLVATWDTIVRRYATRPLRELLRPAIEYARDGFAVFPRLERTIAKLAGKGSAIESLLVDNGVHTGERFRQPAMAATLGDIADGGADAFYRGWIGRSIVDHLAGRGGVLRQQDLTALTVEPLEPIRVGYRGRDVVTHPPVSLGCVLLEELKILEGYDVASLQPDSAELIDLLVACKNAAFADAADLGDPVETENRVEWLLSSEHARESRRCLLRGGDRSVALTAGGSDTTSTVIADEDGTVVTLIQSLFNEFGSRELVPDCGILLNDRLANLSLDATRPSGLRGGRRPLHTLNTYMVIEDGRPVLAGATPGGRGQVQINLQVLVNMLDFGMGVQAAVDQPRWISGLPYRGDNDRTLYLERAFGDGIIEALAGAGHQIQVGVEESEQADPFGNCTVIARSARNATFQGAADIRRDAFAIGW